MARRYTRDNRGRFASAGGGGATARGGRLRTAAGNKRATQTMKAQGAGGAGVMKGKVQRDPGAMAKRDKVASFAARSKMAAQRIDARKNADLAKFGFKGGAGDRAAANIPMSGTRGKRLDAEISRNVKAGRPVAVSRGSRADAKPQAAPKRTRTPESLRISRAKQIEKRRAIKIDNLPSATLAKRAQNSARTQAAALSVYKGKPKPAPKPRPAKPAAKAAPKVAKLAVRGKTRVTVKPAIRTGTIKPNQAISDKQFWRMAQRAQVPSRQEDWGGRDRKQGKRGGNRVIGSMSAAPRGVKSYPDYRSAKGMTSRVWNEAKLMSDEGKRATIGALQAGWRPSRALRLGYQV